MPRIYLATDAPAVRAELDASPFGPFIAPVPAHIKPAEEKSWASHAQCAPVTTVARDELLILARADAVIVHSLLVSFSHTLHRASMCIRARPCPSDTRTRMPQDSTYSMVAASWAAHRAGGQARAISAITVNHLRVEPTLHNSS